jgi:hypothetical protein
MVTDAGILDDAVLAGRDTRIISAGPRRPATRPSRTPALSATR